MSPKLSETSSSLNSGFTQRRSRSWALRNHTAACAESPAAKVASPWLYNSPQLSPVSAVAFGATAVAGCGRPLAEMLRPTRARCTAQEIPASGSVPGGGS